MRMLSRLAKERALKKRRRERRLAAAHEKHDRARARQPLPRLQLELNDEYYSRRQHEQRLVNEYIEAVLP